MARKPKLPALPLAPPLSDRDTAAEQRLVNRLESAVAALRRRSLNQAVMLAQQAACGHGPLIEHFVELGTRYSKLRYAPQKSVRATLRVVKGDKQ